jgi:hypothetical protein
VESRRSSLPVHEYASLWAIQAAAGYMRRLTATGPAFQINPRFVVLGRKSQRQSPVLLDGLEAGYVWDDKSMIDGDNFSGLNINFAVRFGTDFNK